MQFARTAITAFLATAIAAAAHAHVFAVFTSHSVLDPSAGDHSGEPATTVAYIGWGHKTPTEDMLEPERLGRYALIAPDGTETPLTAPGPGFLAVEVAPEVDGAHIIAAAYENHFYTWYKEDGEEKSARAPKSDFEDIVYSGYFEMRGKALVGVGRTEDAAFAEPIGDTLEIVPVENPLRKTGGAYQTLAIRVVFNGAPLADATVHARHFGFYPTTDFAQAVTTDANGEAKIDLNHKGGWLLKVEHEIEPRPEFADQCNIEQYMATLSFEIP